MISNMSKQRAFLIFLFCLCVGGLLAYIFVRWFSLTNTASLIGYLVGFYMVFMILLSEIKKWPWLANRKLTPQEAKNATLAFRLMVFPTCITIILMYMINNQEFMSFLLSFLSIWLLGYGLIILKTLLFRMQKS